MKRTCLISGIAVLLLASTSLCQTSAPKESKTADQEKKEQAKLYTAYNLWYENPDAMSCINYRRGTMIPAGTEVRIEDVKRSGKRPTIKFKTVKDEKTYTIHFTKKFHPGVTVDEFKERLVTNKPLEERTKGMTEKEIECIKKGKLVVGMSKDAVLTARGYPPEHQTSSLEGNVWLFWENRFVKKAVHFDENGRTIKPPEPDSDDL